MKAFALGLAAGLSLGAYIIGSFQYNPDGSHEPTPQKSESDGITFLRGLSQADLKEYRETGYINSYAVRAGGGDLVNAVKKLFTEPLKKLGLNHAQDSRYFESPFVGVTTSVKIAKQFAEDDYFGSPTNLIAIIKTNRAVKNPSGVKEEQEWLIPLQVLSEEIISVVPSTYFDK